MEVPCYLTSKSETMSSRRKFIQLSTLSAAAVCLGTGFTHSQAAEKKLKNFGFISGIVGKEMKADWKAVLKYAAQYSFTEIETGSYAGETVSGFLSYCREVGIKPVIGGIPFTADKTELNKGLDKLAELEMKYAVTYWPWKGGGPFKLEDCRVSAGILNQMGQVCRERGFTFCWHNHDKEFIPMEDGLPFDFLMKNTDKNLVSCEMDIYWVAKGSSDPLKVLKQYAGRIPVLHVKDMAPGPEKDFACPGSGIIDFSAIFSEADKQGIEHYFVERDNVPDGLDCLKTSGEYLRNLRF
jgi:sugar phosphate isomerase/epimerase